MQSELKYIYSYLGECGRNLKRIAIFETGIFFFLGITILLFVTVAGFSILNDVSELRIIFFALTSAFFLLSVAYLLVLNQSKFINFNYLASFVEERIGNLADGLKTIVSLQDGGLKTSAAQKKKNYTKHPATDSCFISEGLFEALVLQMAGSIRKINPRTLVSVRRPLKFLFVFVVVLFSLMGISMFFPAETSQGLNRLFSFSRGGFDLSESPIPIESDEIISDIIITVEYPEYTGNGKKILQGTGGDVSVLEGSVITFEIMSSQNTNSGYFVFKKERDETDRNVILLPLQVEPGNILRFTITLKQTFYYALRITNENGILFQEKKMHAIEAVRDASPAVVIHGDMKEKKEKGEKVDVEYQATDDFGITEIYLNYGEIKQGSVAQRKKILSMEGKRTISGSYPFVIPENTAEDIQSVEVWFEVFDNDNVYGINKGISNKLIFDIDSPSARHREIQNAKEKIFEDMLSGLGLRLSLTHQIDSFQDCLNLHRSAHEQMKNSLRSLEQIPGLLKKDSCLKSSSIQHYETLFQRLEKILLEEEKVLNRIAGSDMDGRTGRNSLAETGEKVILELENAVLSIEELIDRENKEYLLSMGKELNLMKAELKEMIRKLSKETGDKDMKDVLQKIENIQAKIRQIEEEMARQAKILPGSNSNIKYMSKDRPASSLSSVSTQLMKVRDLLMSNDLEGASSLVEDIQADIDSLMAMWSLSLGQTDVSSLLNARSRLKEFISETEGLIEKERGILESTADLSHAYQKRSQLFSESVVERSLTKITAKVEKAQNFIREVDRKVMKSDDVYRLNGLAEDLDNLVIMLQKGIVEPAAKLASSASKDLSLLGSDIFEQAYLVEKESSSAILKDSARNVKSASVYVKQAAKELENLIPKSDQFLTAEEIAFLKQIQSKQQGLKNKFDGLKSKVSEFTEEIPALSVQALRSLDDSGTSINDSLESLEMLKPKTAEMHQRVAIQNMLKFKRSMEHLLEGAAQEYIKTPSLPDKVEIPKPAETELSRAFKEEIERAMKESAVKKYEKIVKKYFESLLR